MVKDKYDRSLEYGLAGVEPARDYRNVVDSFLRNNKNYDNAKLAFGYNDIGLYVYKD